MKILILSCGTGEGHNSAAKAVAAELENRSVDCEIADVLSFKSERAKNRAAKVYSAVITKYPALFGFVYKLGKAYDCLRLPSPIYSMHAVYAEKLNGYIKQNGFTCVICTHLFAMEAMTAVRRKYGISGKCFGVITDYTAIPFYKDTDLDGYFVPNAETGEQLVKKGIRGDRVFITGIPVHFKFAGEVTAEEAREILNLPENKKIITVMTGGAGCGRIVKLCKKLVKLQGDNLVIVMSGKNGRLKAELDKKFSGRVLTVGFTADVHLYIKAADAVISKAGGLSSTEVAVSNVPLVHLKAIPGVETANFKYFYENGLSLGAVSVKGAARAAEQLICDGQCAAAMLKIQRLFIGGDAAVMIADAVTENYKNEYVTMGNIYSGRIYAGEHNVLQNDSRTVNA